jgi:hypothetical protein
MAALVGDVASQQNFIKAFRTRRLHPAVEAMVWHLAIGKPTDQNEVTAAAEMHARLAAEREILLKLDREDLELLLKETEATMAKAHALAEGRRLLPAGTSSRQDAATSGGAGGELDEPSDNDDVGDAKQRARRRLM